MNENNQDLINRLNLLLEMNTTINTTRNLNELLNKIINVTSAVMRSEASSIALLDESTNELVFQFVHGSASDKVRKIRVAVGTGISGWVAKYGVPLIIPDAQNDPRFNNKVDKESNFVTKSVICIPLKRNEKVIGILQSLNKKNDSTFTSEDLSIFESLGGIATIAIENAQLYKLLSQKIEQLEIEKHRNDYILNQLKKSEEETEKLRNISKNKADFSGNLGIFRVENLLQMLSNDYKTGRLTLNSSEGIACIFLNSGKLQHAELKSRSLEGLNAFYETICWLDGTFNFEQDVITSKNTINKMVMSIVIEGLRRLDETNSLKERYNYNYTPKLVETNYKSNNEEMNKVISFIDGKRNIKEIINNSEIDRYTCLLSIKDLHERNIISFE